MYSTSNIGYFTKGYGAEVTFESIYIMCTVQCERPCKKESNLQGYTTIHFITVFANIHHTRVLYYIHTCGTQTHPCNPVYTLVSCVSSYM